jgi:hypothetical protein
MIEKIQGNIQFKDLPLNRFTEKDSWFKEKMKHIFKIHDNMQYELEHWALKKQIRMFYNVKGTKKNIVIKAVNEDCKESDCMLYAKKAIDLANKSHLVFFVRPFDSSCTISQ